METKGQLIEIERKLSHLYKIVHVKTVWLLNTGDENTAAVSVILDDTKKGYAKAHKKATSYIRRLESSKTPPFVFNTYRLSEYWSRLVSGDAKLYSEMRLSIILYDPAGFFAPLKVLLLEGKIPCTRESAYNMLVSAPEKIMRVRKEIKSNVLAKLYNLVIDAGQAPLVLKGIDPPIPKMLPDALMSVFSRHELPKKDIDTLRNIISYYKDIEHGKIPVISSDNLHMFLESSEGFIKSMELLMKRTAGKCAGHKSYSK